MLAGIALLAALLGFAAGVLFARRSAPAPQPPSDQSRLRHDLRGALSPALLIADQLTTNPSPDIARSAERIKNAIDRAVDLLRTADETAG